MAILSEEHSDRLYWLGRYSERVYTTIKIFSQQFDSMIDIDADKYEDFCNKQDIPNIYSSKEDFTKRYCFDENDPNSIFSNLIRVYDNAVVLREEIGSETLCYVQLAIYAMNKAKKSDAPILHLQKVIDNIVAFWGMADDSIDSEIVRSIIKFDKRLERVDLYARMQFDPAEIKREMKRLSLRIPQTGLKYNNTKLAHLNYLVEMFPLDNKMIIEELETLFDINKKKISILA